MRIPRLIVATILMALVGSAAEAQIVSGRSTSKKAPKKAPKMPKNPESKGGALDPEKNLKKSRLSRWLQTDTPGPKVAFIPAGATVAGRTAAGAVQKIRFEGVRGARVSLELVSVTRTLTGKGSLHSPRAKELSKLSAVKAKPGTYLLKDFELKTSGVYTVNVSLDKGATGDFRLDTKMEIPGRSEDEREWREGRPRRILLGGMTGRSISDLTVRAKDRSLGLDFTARLFDPDGLPVDLSPYLLLAHGGSTLSLRKLPLGIPGDYELFVADKSRATGDGVITIRFDNPPTGKGKVRM